MREHVPVLIQKETIAFRWRKWRLSRNDVEVDQHRDAPNEFGVTERSEAFHSNDHQEIDLGGARLRNRDGQNGSKCEAVDHHGA